MIVLLRDSIFDFFRETENVYETTCGAWDVSKFLMFFYKFFYILVYKNK